MGQSFPLIIAGDQLQSKIHLAVILILLKQTRRPNHISVSAQHSISDSHERVSNLTPPTCDSFPFVSFCGCARPCSFHNASPVSHPSGPACMSSPACSSATGSQSEVDPPLTHATPTSTHEFLNRVWIYSQKVAISATLPSTAPQG